MFMYKEFTKLIFVYNVTDEWDVSIMVLVMYLQLMLSCSKLLITDSVTKLNNYLQIIIRRMQNVTLLIVSERVFDDIVWKWFSWRFNGIN